MIWGDRKGDCFVAISLLIKRVGTRRILRGSDDLSCWSKSSQSRTYGCTHIELSYIILHS